jgi:hypothetical protein
MRYYWFQDDPYAAREALSDAELFYAAARFLCRGRPFEQVKSLASAIMVGFCAETIEGKQALVRLPFDHPAHANISQLLFALFRQYSDGRPVDPMLLRFPRLPAPRDASPKHHWAHTTEPAVRELPPRSHTDLRTCIYGFFFGFAGYDELPSPPNWIAPLLSTQNEDEAAIPPNPEAVPQLPR